VRVVAVVMVLAVGYVGFNLIRVVQVGARNDAVVADAIVVMGAAQWDGRPSPVLQGRLDRALQLWRDGAAPLVVVTGGKQPGDRTTEASTGAQYLIANGVPDRAVLLEVQGTSTWESLAAARRFLRPLGVDRVIVVSDSYHLLRVQLIGDEVGFADTWTASSDYEPEQWDVAQVARETMGVSVGRIVSFRRLTNWVDG
jgi:uncharacterized SAM-binding protein YcdF (DUF218 family)